MRCDLAAGCRTVRRDSGRYPRWTAPLGEQERAPALPSTMRSRTGLLRAARAGVRVLQRGTFNMHGHEGRGDQKTRNGGAFPVARPMLTEHA